MKSLDLSKLNVFTPRLDWLSVVGDVPHIHREDDLEAIIQFFNSIGFHQRKDKQRPVFRSNELGVEVCFGKKKTDQTIFLKIEFQGQFFADSIENSEASIKTFVRKIWSQFGVSSPPRATRIDVAIDVAGVSPAEVIPNLASERYDLVGKSKNKINLRLTRHNSDKENIKKETGIFLQNDRFQFCVYERILMLEEYRQKAHKKWYVEYYDSQYGDAKEVTRVEVRFGKNLCDYFTESFFLAGEELGKCIKKSLAHFNRHHRFIDRKTDKFIIHIDQLFCSEDYETIKTLRLRNNISTDARDLCFSRPFSNLNAPLSLITRVMLANNLTTNEDILDVSRKIKIGISKEASSVKNKLESFQKTLEIFNFNQERQQKLAQSFKQESMRLNEIKRRNQSKSSQKELDIRVMGTLEIEDIKSKFGGKLDEDQKSAHVD